MRATLSPPHRAAGRGADLPQPQARRGHLRGVPRCARAAWEQPLLWVLRDFSSEGFSLILWKEEFMSWG